MNRAAMTFILPRSLYVRLPHRDIKPPLVILVIERNERREGLVEWLVDLRLEKAVERRRLIVVPDQLGVSGRRFRRMALKVTDAVVLLVADQTLEHRTPCAGGGAEDRKAL